MLVLPPGGNYFFLYKWLKISEGIDKQTWFPRGDLNTTFDTKNRYVHLVDQLPQVKMRSAAVQIPLVAKFENFTMYHKTWPYQFIETTKYL